MSHSKSNYPERPANKKRPKSSSSGGGKRKVWQSLVTKVESGRDVSPRMQDSWYNAPMYREARLKKWA